ncbi:hypothetical protein AB0N09_28075 [Streptomyces erythrochromogenes]|uniref:hypothetical protein n=1 Tax=Streptomyces erythrochromogenes TaxID=285574 RepID=UPI0034237028
MRRSLYRHILRAARASRHAVAITVTPPQPYTADVRWSPEGEGWNAVDGHDELWLRRTGTPGSVEAFIAGYLQPYAEDQAAHLLLSSDELTEDGQGLWDKLSRMERKALAVYSRAPLAEHPAAVLTAAREDLEQRWRAAAPALPLPFYSTRDSWGRLQLAGELYLGCPCLCSRRAIPRQGRRYDINTRWTNCSHLLEMAAALGEGARALGPGTRITIRPQP